MRITNEVLDDSKLQHKAVKLNLQAFNLAELLNDLNQSFSPQAQAKHLSFSIENHLQIPHNLITDKMRLQQALSNLLSNAIQFTQQGEVKLIVKAIQQGHTLIMTEFCISDTGIGINPALHATLFQAAQATGLNVAHQLVEYLDGELVCDSHWGEGCQFSFILPLAVEADDFDHLDKIPPPLIPSPQHNTRHVLLVEDNEDVLFLTCSFLKTLGVSVDTAINGEDFLHIIQQQPDRYQLVIMDCEMPKLDGYAACQQWRQFEQKNHRHRLPIIALSAHTGDKYQLKALGAGMDDFIHKPFQFDSFALVVSKWLSTQKTQKLSTPIQQKVTLNNPLLNTERLSLFDIEDIEMIVGLFLQHTPKTVVNIKQACHKNNSDALYQAAHKLKSSAATLGAEMLAEYCHTIENLTHCSLDDLTKLNQIIMDTDKALNAFIEQQRNSPI